jgi:hypothetical protein
MQQKQRKKNLLKMAFKIDFNKFFITKRNQSIKIKLKNLKKKRGGEIILIDFGCAILCL